MTHTFPFTLTLGINSKITLSMWERKKKKPAKKKVHLGLLSVDPSYLPHLKSMAETPTLSQSHKCPLQTHKTQMAGPGHQQAAGLQAQREFQFGLPPGRQHLHQPGELPDESGGKAAGWGGRMHYLPSATRRPPLHVPTPTRTPGVARTVRLAAAVSDQSGGVLGWPSSASPTSPQQEWAPPTPPPPQVSAGRGLTLHQQQDAPQQHGRASGKREEGCRLAAGLLALGERERGSGDAGGPGEVQRQSASRELPTLQSEPSGNETPACRARCAELQRRVRPSWSPATAGLGREETTAGTLLKGQWLLGEREVGSQCLRPGF
jgi:hypothetical protein